MPEMRRAHERPEAIETFSSLFPNGDLPDPFEFDAFDEATRGLGGPLSERLRWLAIWCETENSRWPRVRALYQRAHELSPGDSVILHSWSITAREYVNRADSTLEAAALLEEARTVARRAIDLDPRDAELNYALGLACYDDRDRDVEEAAAMFRQALSCDGGYAPARLYLAHCLHDQGRWEEALAEYVQVDPQGILNAINDQQSWRLLLLKEQIGHCQWRVGRMEEAIRTLTSFLDDYERAEDAEKTPPRLCLEVAEEAGEPLLARVRRLYGDEQAGV